MVLPEYAEFNKMKLGEPFSLYDECTALAGECNVSYYAGIVVLNKDTARAKVERDITVYEQVN
jgi:hypothetical protein